MLKNFNQWLNESIETLDREELKRLINNVVIGNTDYMIFTERDGKRLVQIIEENPFIKNESLAFLRAKGVTTLFRGISDAWDPEWDEWELGLASFTYNKKIAEEFSAGGDIVQVSLTDAEPDFLLSIEWVSDWLSIEKLSPDEVDTFTKSDGWDDTDNIGFRGMVESQYECLVRWPNIGDKCELAEED